MWSWESHFISLWPSSQSMYPTVTYPSLHLCFSSYPSEVFWSDLPIWKIGEQGKVWILERNKPKCIIRATNHLRAEYAGFCCELKIPRQGSAKFSAAQPFLVVFRWVFNPFKLVISYSKSHIFLSPHTYHEWQSQMLPDDKCELLWHSQYGKANICPRRRWAARWPRSFLAILHSLL